MPTLEKKSSREEFEEEEKRGKVNIWKEGRKKEQKGRCGSVKREEKGARKSGLRKRKNAGRRRKTYKENVG